MKSCCVAVVFLALGALPTWARENKAPAGSPTAEELKNDPDHKALIEMREGIANALDKGDIDKMLTFLDEEIVVTYMNGEVSRKPAGVKAYFDRMMKGEQRIVNHYKPAPKVDEYTHF